MKKLTLNETTMKSLRLRQDVVEKIEKMAIKDNRSFNNMVETILIQTPEIRM